MESEVHIGQLVAGKYRIEQTLGRGGMGVVVAALHEQLNQRVALKFLTDNAYQQPEAVARFVREARAAVQIQSEHVARVMDVGTLDSGAPYMVMEYLRGRDLKEVSSRRGALPISEAVDFLLQACDAVAEAHSLGIVHRDLKPSNLFLSERPDGSPLVKVLDFGISKALHAGERDSQLQMTASAAIMGSPQYMSPEQIRSSKTVDARADVWALGTILHELLTGSPAYVADTVPGLLAMIVADAPPPLCASRRDAPAELEAIILRCLEKDRERRYPNVAALARALERFASIETRPLVRRIARVLREDAPPPAELAPSPRSNVSSPEPAAQTNNPWSRTGHQRERAGRTPLHLRRGVQVAAGIVGLLGLGVLFWSLAPGRGRHAEPSAVAAGASAASATLAAPAAPAAAPPSDLAAGHTTSRGSALLPSAGGSPPLAEARIRPIVEPVEEAKPAPSASRRASPKADSTADSTRSAKKVASGGRPAARTAPAPPRPSRTARTAADPSPPAEAPPPRPPAAPAKKADTLQDLFNDTK